MRFVAGFLFNEDRSAVLLIRKEKPKWQAGKLNAIGGKMEDAEGSVAAMEREFHEEAGVVLDKWRLFCVLHHDGNEVYFFERCISSDDIDRLYSKTEEQIGWHRVDRLDKLPVMLNLRWLIPLACCPNGEFVTAYDPKPIPKDAS